MVPNRKKHFQTKRYSIPVFFLVVLYPFKFQHSKQKPQSHSLNHKKKPKLYMNGTKNIGLVQLTARTKPKPYRNQHVCAMYP